MNTPADKPDLPPIPHAALYSRREQLDLIEWATGIAEAARADERRKARAELIAELKPVAWIDDGSTGKPSDHSPHRVVTDETKRAMPASVAAAYSQPLAAIPKE